MINETQQISWELLQSQVDGDQIPNPTVGLKVNGVGLKFHAHPIQVVVGFEE